MHRFFCVFWGVVFGVYALFFGGAYCILEGVAEVG